MSNFKYNEEEILRNIQEYIVSTYGQHYASGNDIQVNDLIMAIGHGEGSYVSNAIEYLARYGKKDGKNVKDLYKAIHNIILLIYLNHVDSRTQEDIASHEAQKVKQYCDPLDYNPLDHDLAFGLGTSLYLRKCNEIPNN